MPILKALIEKLIAYKETLGQVRIEREMERERERERERKKIEKIKRLKKRENDSRYKSGLNNSV